jgi:hypothetical protein
MGSSPAGVAAAAQVAQGFTNIVTAITTDITTIGSIQIFDVACDETAIYIALTEFVAVHQALLRIVIGKGQIISEIPLAGIPVAAALRALEGVVDAIATAIIHIIPNQASCAQTQFGNLNGTLTSSLTSYSSCEAPSACAAGQIAGSAQSIIDAIDAITTISQGLQAPAGSLSATNPSAITVGRHIVLLRSNANCSIGGCSRFRKHHL